MRTTEIGIGTLNRSYSRWVGSRCTEVNLKLFFCLVPGPIESQPSIHTFNPNFMYNGKSFPSVARRFSVAMLTGGHACSNKMVHQQKKLKGKKSVNEILSRTKIASDECYPYIPSINCGIEIIFSLREWGEKIEADSHLTSQLTRPGGYHEVKGFQCSWPTHIQ